ncbi:hypothetical protein CR194_17560 [Salipaludibacillus keqinensis]|uniref:Cytoplasmic protein n=1 Tax=Salipaludibacillus keqinensis TaxID=2045207 RepID=A0A323THC6_9BACI|nr:DUF1836 domain-containing protein [Salipaludibacillus keqinensis]PYZ92003.1 hypothetical protein CR194_17560 [Salipaludibacillus keqinensis]
MKSLNELLQNLRLDNQVAIENIPDLDLYMDQVIQLFDKTFADSKRHDNDKILTKTMINNYAKGGLLLPIKNKRYSKDHVMLLGLIYELKGALSINDIKKILTHINTETSEDGADIEDFYSRYLHLSSSNASEFSDEMNRHLLKVTEQVKDIEGDEYVQQVLTILSLINMSNLYRKTAEKLIDQLPSIN